MKVAVDTMLLIWYFDRRPSPAKSHRAEMQHRTAVLFRILEDEHKQIVLPSIAVSELLVPMSGPEREAFLSRLHGDFECPTFDLKAAAIAAQLHAVHSSFSERDRYEKRPALKTDILIMATAKAAGAVEFYSHDKKARNLASQIMIAKDLPTSHPNFVVEQELKGSLIDSNGPKK